ncbi:putative RNA-directed DNA polymerase [Helianthus anomalus]
MADYCQHAKHLAEQLQSVGSPVDDRMLVIKVLTGLTEQFDSISTVLQNRDPLPDFNEVRSRLTMEEQKKKRQVTRGSQAAATALAATSVPPANATHQSSYYGPSNRGRGRSRGGRGRGRSFTGRGNNRTTTQPQNPAHPYIVFPSNWTAAQWASLLNTNNSAQPPCPYPSRPNSQSSQGILGPCPDQAHHTGYSPTDIEQALYSLALNQPDHGVMDTGATSHSANEQGIYSPSNFNKCTNKNIVVGNGMTIPVVAQGNQVLPPPYPPLKLNNVLFAPQIIKNLISVRRLTTDNLVSIEFDPFGFLVKDLKTRAPILRCNSTGDLYPLTAPLPLPSTQPSAFATISQDRWHQRLGHPGDNLLQSLKLSTFVDFGKFNKTICQSCIFGKSVKFPFYDSVNCTRSAFDIVHSDLWTSPVLSTGGHKYYILFLDDFTNFMWTFPIATKAQVFHTFTTLHNSIHTQFERKIKQFQCDNGKEYANQNFYNFCNHNGMQFRFSCPYTSSQNGKAERKIRTINNMVRTLLAQASLPANMWHHALDTATYLLNILPSKTHHFKSPTTLLYNCTPEYDHLRVFGCLCYPLAPSTTIHKLDYRSHPCVFLGYPPNHRGYRCLDLTSHQLIISRHVHFEESIFPYHIQSPTKPPSYDYLNPTINPLVWDYLNNSHKPSPYNPPPPTTPTDPTPPSPTPSNSLGPQPNPSQDRNPPHTSDQTSPHPSAQSFHPSAQSSHPSAHSPSTSPVQPTLVSPSATFSAPHSTPIVPDQPMPPPTIPARTIHTRSMSGIVKPKQLFNLHTSTIVPIPKNP